jgi:hypothetical protein
MRGPTEAQLAQLGKLLAAAGGIAELSHWIKLAAIDASLKRPRGRPAGSNKFEDVDRQLLFSAGQHFVFDSEEMSFPPMQAVIRRTVDEKFESTPRHRWHEIGASKAAVVRRIMDKLKSAFYLSEPGDSRIPPLAIVKHVRNELTEISGFPPAQIKRKNQR